jgi:trk system potassium uptake protein
MKVIIVGGGQVGSYIASLLLTSGHEICIIENREKVYKKIEKEFPVNTLIFGSGSDPEILEAAGIYSANVVAAVTGTDEVNLVVATLAKLEFGISRVVARVNNPKNAWLFNSGMGVDVGINQAEILAHFVVNEMCINDIFANKTLQNNITP